MAAGTLTWGGIVMVLVLIAFSAFFSSVETAIFSLSPEWIDDQAAGNDRRAKILQNLREDPHRLLVTVLVGNNLVNVAITSIVTALISAVASPGVAVVAATVVVTCLILIFGEIVPKSYGFGNAQQWALTMAYPITLIERGLSPLVSLFDGITRRITARIQGDSRIEQPYLD